MSTDISVDITHSKQDPSYLDKISHFKTLTSYRHTYRRMLNESYRCSWTDNNSNHEVLVLAKSRTFVSLAIMRKRKCLYFGHKIGVFPCWRLKCKRKGNKERPMTKNVDNIKDWQRWTKESNVRTTTVHD